jgi:hypothetical protein
MLERNPNASQVPDVAPPIRHEVLRSPGAPLDQETRAFYEPRFAEDFSEVRVHTDERAADSASAGGASAYTAGNQIVVGELGFAPNTARGRRLLAHELTPVIQQGRSPANQDIKAGLQDDHNEEIAERNAKNITISRHSIGPSRALGPQIQRQQLNQPQAQPQGAGALAPAFSVDQVTYSRKVSQAISLMSGRFVSGQTMAGSVVPMVQAMLPQVTWRDSNNVDHGGGIVQYPRPGAPGQMLNLHLILDDQADPLDAGRFHETGPNDAEIFVRIRKNPGAEELALTMYHESMHMMSWLINRPGGAATPGAHSAVGRALDRSRFSTQITSIRNALDQLAQSVNSRRPPGQAITPAMLDRTAPWLMEEVQVRAETEVFRLALGVQQARASRGPSVIIGTGENSEVNPAMVDRYLFDFSHAFLPGDRADLSPQDREGLRILSEILEGFFQGQVRRQFSLSAYTTTIPRAPFEYTPPPLQPPTMRPLPLP